LALMWPVYVGGSQESHLRYRHFFLQLMWHFHTVNSRTDFYSPLSHFSTYILYLCIFCPFKIHPHFIGSRTLLLV
jgi:hypothetical protein